MRNIDFVRQCFEKNNLRVAGFKKSLINMRLDKFTQDDADFFTGKYFSIKGDADDTSNRSLLLQAIALQCLQYDLKEFFRVVFTKERKLDNRLTAIRGYAAYATEEEVCVLVDKFITLLLKTESNLSRYYLEYTFMTSKFGLPYLYEHYGYDCFKKANEELFRLYENLTENLKGYFTLDEHGFHVPLLSNEEITRRFRASINQSYE